MPVDVAAGVPAVLGEAVVEGSNKGREVVKVRDMEGYGRRKRAERKQLEQIIVSGGWYRWTREVEREVETFW